MHYLIIIVDWAISNMNNSYASLNSQPNRKNCTWQSIKLLI